MARAVSPRVETSKDTRRPLAGIRVIDLTRAAATPFAMLILALLGAEVIKVEEPGTAQQRRSTFAPDPNMDSKSFTLMNHDKKSVTLNLKSEIGIEMLKEMVKKADLFVEDMTLGVAERLGIGYDVLKAINPRLIYVSNKGYRTPSPYKNYPAVNPTVEAMGGPTSVNGFPGDPPVRVGPAIGDWCTGMYNVMTMLAALYYRDITGTGRKVEASMEEAMATYTADWQHIYLEHGVIPPPRGSSLCPPRPGLKMPKGCYVAKDGYVVVHAVNDEQWQALLKGIGRNDLLNDPRFGDEYKRREHAGEIDKIIEDWTKQHGRYEAMEKLGGAGVICGAVLDTKEAIEDPYLNQSGFYKRVYSPKSGETPVFGLPVRFSDCESGVQAACPVLGQHNEQVYAELLGYRKEELADLHEQGVI